MHQVDDDGHVANRFDEGDPGVPRQPTRFSAAMFNAMMMEIANPVTESGQTLIKGTWDQLAKAIGFFGGSGGARAIADSLVGELMNLINTGAGIALKISGSGTSLANAVLDLTNNSTGPVLNGAGASGSVPLAKLKNFGNGVALELEGVNGRAPIKLVPVSTIPSLNGAGAALGAGDKGLMCFWTGTDKLIVWDGATWQPCW